MIQNILLPQSVYGETGVSNAQKSEREAWKIKHASDSDSVLLISELLSFIDIIFILISMGSVVLFSIVLKQVDFTAVAVF